MSSNEQKDAVVNIEDIVPHRYPFLMIDRILERNPGVSATCQKNVSNNEPYFQGHFPGYPVMPGVMLCEAMAQSAGIASGRTHGMKDVGILASMNNVKFRKPVFPGDVIIMKSVIENIRMNVIKASTIAYVNDENVASANYTLVIIPDIFSEQSPV